MTDIALSPRRQALAQRGADKRLHILDAAERCFARAGFHRATMNDVAAEAGMSPGNLYRYFVSKDDLVVGIAERDRAMLQEDFIGLGAGSEFGLTTAEEFLAALRAMAVKHMLDEPRHKAVLVLEIWSEAARNPKLAELCMHFDESVLGRLEQLIRAAAEQGVIRPLHPPAACARMIGLMADGVYRARAVLNDLEARENVEAMLAATATLLGVVAEPPKPELGQ